MGLNLMPPTHTHTRPCFLEVVTLMLPPTGPKGVPLGRVCLPSPLSTRPPGESQQAELMTLTPPSLCPRLALAFLLDTPHPPPRRLMGRGLQMPMKRPLFRFV